MFSMVDIHDIVFELLLERYFAEKKAGNNFFFNMRQRFLTGKERYWFLGNDDYLALTF